ncbi:MULTISPECIES: HTH domain-containing protein [Bradyrhizobium]|jgi:predicted NUDIX family phosphoesterase/dephospho-CoA kinase|uniref:HTH domain-containing protein n=1 Tax=Bradyrhizobium TaxID=374 RepID=UPI000463B347|nr:MULTISPECIES: HTH domain-containing protein [Bradyrhizobium]MBK5656385.1 AAA family ATPase [Rhizobium sp.]
MHSYEKQTVPVQNHRDSSVDGDHQTYLRVAEIVLGKSTAPLNAREIVERGIEQGLFGDHVMGRTPQKSMQARLSVDILSRGTASSFVRTARGRFTLRSSIEANDLGAIGDAGPAEYVAQRRVLRTPKEEVLCVPEAAYRDVLTFQGIDTDAASILNRFLNTSTTIYVGRADAETRNDAKQFITYVLVQCGQRLLFFKRSYLSRAAEFLRGSKCIGFGGHVSAADLDMLSRNDFGLSSCARRELMEELYLPDHGLRRRAQQSGTEGDHPNKATIRLFQNAPLERLGVLNDDSSEVGRRHFAVVYRVWLPDWSAVRRLQKGDSSIKGIGWIDLSRDAIDIAEFEYWSQLCLRRFYPSTLITKARYEILNNSRLASDRVVVVAGRIGSGKSETAGYLSQQLNCPLIKTGELVKELMSSPPLAEIGREEFQSRAHRFIIAPGGTEKLAEAIVEQIEKNAGSRVIVDGIRNLDTYERLEKKCADSVGLLFVQTPPDVAFDMYRAREASSNLTFSYREFLKVYDAPVEDEIPSLGRRANAYIYNSFGMEAFRRTLDALVPKLSS